MPISIGQLSNEALNVKTALCKFTTLEENLQELNIRIDRLATRLSSGVGSEEEIAEYNLVVNQAEALVAYINSAKDELDLARKELANSPLVTA